MNALNTSPLISVVIPAYSCQQQLQRCLQSVLLQSFSDIEVILIDDGSTDDTYAVARKLASEDSRLHVFKQENKGAGAARNNGLAMARGAFVHFLDADDWLSPNVYSELSVLIASNDIDLMLFQYTEVDCLTRSSCDVDLFALGQNDHRFCLFPEDRQLLLNTSVVPWNKLVRRQYILQKGIRFDEIKYANDRTFHFKVVAQAEKVLLVGNSVVNHEVNQTDSLVGERGPVRVEATLQAFHNTIIAIGKYDKSIEMTIIDRGMADLAWLYHRAVPEQKSAVAFLLWEWVQSDQFSYDLELFANTSWYATFCIIRSVVLSRELDGDLIPLVMATNEAYVPYLMVALHSVSVTLNKGSVCLVYIFHTGLLASTVQRLQSELELSNLHITCVRVSEVEQLDQTFLRAHYSNEMYLRLWIPELLDIYPKVIYLDCDTIVKSSLTELFKVDISDYDLAGVRDFNNKSHRQYVQQDLGIDTDSYVNSGVLVFNTARCLKNDFRPSCLDILAQHVFLNCPDQDIINIACAGKILLLDSGWNYLWNYGFAKYRMPPDGEAWFKEDLANAKKKCYIIHYSSAFKPWLYPLYEDAEYFWEHARLSPAYREICNNAVNKKVASLVKRIDEMNQEARVM